MVELGDGLARFFVRLVRAGASLLGSVGCLAVARFVYEKWHERRSAPEHV